MCSSSIDHVRGIDSRDKASQRGGAGGGGGLVIQNKSEVGMGAPTGIGCVPIDLKGVTFHLGASVSSSINGNIVKTKSRYL